MKIKHCSVCGEEIGATDPVAHHPKTRLRICCNCVCIMTILYRDPRSDPRELKEVNREPIS